MRQRQINPDNSTCHGRLAVSDRLNGAANFDDLTHKLMAEDFAFSSSE